MNVLPESDIQESQDKALKLLNRLLKTPQLIAKKSKDIPFFEFPDGPESFRVTRGWNYPVPEWFKDRLGFKTGQETYYKTKAQMSAFGLKKRKPEEKGVNAGKYKYERTIEFQSSAFCFRKGDVIWDSMVTFKLVDSEGNKKPIVIDGLPTENKSYVQVTDALPAIPEFTSINKDTKERIFHERDAGSVTFKHNQDGEETIHTVTQDEFVRFLITGKEMDDIQQMLEEEEVIQIYVLGSSGNSYIVSFEAYEDEESLMVSCDCPAGSRDQMCKHKAALIKGDDSIMDPEYMTGREAEFEHVQKCVIQYGLDKLMQEYEAKLAELEAEKKRIAKQVTAEKKRFARILSDGVKSGKP
ncbi:hypothetical protein [Maridesulfovibrio sp.]|uniref:hypothetical protein n=1 Tax=Maridesulfovibrio sp. TaxID=2795000 RepID=UPI003B000F3B